MVNVYDCGQYQDLAIFILSLFVGLHIFLLNLSIVVLVPSFICGLSREKEHLQCNAMINS